MENNQKAVAVPTPRASSPAGRTVAAPNRRIEYRSKSDDQGRCSFDLFWMADYHPGAPQEHCTAERGQSFFADPRT